ncbi:MAG: hypothetical protein IH845_01940 [Nanoarchaeota archaeon]|nr:hypothetical protein [Nanoarchaeota archaeon]
MKLKKINSLSAIGVGIVFTVFYFALSLFQIGRFLVSTGADVSLITYQVLVQTFIFTPIGGGITGFVFAFLAILAYNKISSKYPISWEVAK